MIEKTSVRLSDNFKRPRTWLIKPLKRPTKIANVPRAAHGCVAARAFDTPAPEGTRDLFSKAGITSF